MTDVNKICHEAIQTYGVDAQVDMMIEEMSELTKALLKYRRAYGQPETVLGLLVENILEEMADVEIVLLQMHMIFGETGGMSLLKHGAQSVLCHFGVIVHHGKRVENAVP